MLQRVPPDLSSIKVCHALDGSLRFGEVVDQESALAMLNGLGQATGSAANDRCAGHHRLDRHQPEWLRPRTQHHGRQRAGDQRVAIVWLKLAHELGHAIRYRRLYGTVQHLLFVTFMRLAGNLERDTRSASKVNRLLNALFPGHPADQGQVVPWLLAEQRIGGGEAVMNGIYPVCVRTPSPLA